MFLKLALQMALDDHGDSHERQRQVINTDELAGCSPTPGERDLGRGSAKLGPRSRVRSWRTPLRKPKHWLPARINVRSKEHDEAVLG